MSVTPVVVFLLAVLLPTVSTTCMSSTALSYIFSVDRSMMDFEYGYSNKCESDSLYGKPMAAISRKWRNLQKQLHVVIKTYKKNSWSKRNDSHCYMVFKNRNAFWDVAERICSDMDSHLLSIESTSENKWIKTLVGSYYYARYPFWMGLTSGEQEFYWSHNNRKPTVNHFASGYPKNAASRCVYFLNGYWYNTSCKENRYFICEKDSC